MDTCIYILVSYISILMWWGEVYAQTPKIFNVIDFGAVGDGLEDDTEAFVKAWNATCEEKYPEPTLQISKGKTFLLKPIKFEGPCKSSNIKIELLGEMVAPNAISDFPQNTPKSWLEVSYVDGLTITGDGKINGSGQVWWKTCKGHVCPRRPSTANFIGCNNLRLEKLGFFNSPNNHISIISCTNVLISQLQIQAPEDSVNTEGIDISFSNGISIDNSVIATGGDCVAITNDSYNISITGVACGPGHGISIGSLGKGGGTDSVQGVHVSNCTFTGTQNGARIKTWQGGKGVIKNITFEHIVFVNASNPIFIDQFYCPHQQCANQTDAVKISDATYRNIVGTTPSETAILLHCSQSNNGCTNIAMLGIIITSSIPGKLTHADCFDVQGQQLNPVIPSLNNCLN